MTYPLKRITSSHKALSHKASVFLASAMSSMILLSGCSASGDWPWDKKSDVIAPIQRPMVQTADATFMPPVTMDDGYLVHNVPLHGDHVSTLERVRSLEEELARLRGEMAEMLPIMAQLADNQVAMTQAMGHTPPVDTGPAVPSQIPLDSKIDPSLSAFNKGKVNRSTLADQDPNAAYVAPEKAAVPHSAPTNVKPPINETLQKSEVQLPADSAPVSMAPVILTDTASAHEQLAANAASSLAPAASGNEKSWPAEGMPQTVAEPSQFQGREFEVVSGAQNLPAITEMRVGENRGYIRVVLESQNPVSYNYEVDNENKIILVRLPGSRWSAPQSGSVPQAPLITEYQVAPDNLGGSNLALQLNGRARVLKAQTLGPEHGKGHRIVIDIAAL
jgi:hypothetical protein